ncbi:phosphatase PAP2 family protein [Coralloluteibacterium thermophilus]|uniref:undecaprenyl-diphosphate phosphatase n=1 Tax=Coralloluteibacterium thermophilum TaxID=2707049 RepID=A0ABV9NPW5_9GAMM
MRPDFPNWLVRRVGLRVGVLFLALLALLLGFAELAEEVREGEGFDFDEPLLAWAQTWHGPALDRFFVVVSALGYAWGVIPLDIAIPLVLLWLRRLRDAVFFVLGVGGSALLNMSAKAFFQRERPTLWESIAPEATFSFPSGHAMGSMAMSACLVVLSWRTRWRWPMLLGLGLFVLLVGVSRVYLGVHFPSDVLAGWIVAVAWVIGVHLLMHVVAPRRAR